jgi:hypothetical protein
MNQKNYELFPVIRKKRSVGHESVSFRMIAVFCGGSKEFDQAGPIKRIDAGAGCPALGVLNKKEE